MCIKIMETQGTINQEEFNFFSFGAGMVDRTQQRPNNADWMPPVVWDNLTEMDKIPGFQVIPLSLLLSNISPLTQSTLTNLSCGYEYNPCALTLTLNLYLLCCYQGIVSSFEQMQREWKVWYMSGKPEIEPMPADWSIKTR